LHNTYSQRHIVEENVEPGSSSGKVLSHQPGDHLSLGDELTGIKLSDDALENLIDNRGQHALVVVGA
jgi:hypothetical protein